MSTFITVQLLCWKMTVKYAHTHVYIKAICTDCLVVRDGVYKENIVLIFSLSKFLFQETARVLCLHSAWQNARCNIWIVFNLNYVIRFVYPSLLLLCEQDKKVTKTYNFTSMSALPCGCPRKKSPKARETKSMLFEYLLWSTSRFLFK